MAINENMTPGGDSRFTGALRLLRGLQAALQRVERDKAKGFTNTPVANRGLIILSDGTDLYLEMLDALIKNIKGLGGSDGKSVVFSDRYNSEDLDNALADISAEDMVYHKGAWYYKTTAGQETNQLHVLLNSSFENFEGGEPEFWTRKP